MFESWREPFFSNYPPLLQVDVETTVQTTVCRCNHLTTFAAGWIVAPNKIDFNYIFKNIQFDKNATLYATEIAIAILFLLLFIWARRKDNSDVQKVGLTEHLRCHCYHIVVTKLNLINSFQ